MSNLIENNLIRFVGISKKKDGLFVNFKLKGLRGGVVFTSTIIVDLSSVNVNPAVDSLETIIEESSQLAIREFKKSEPQLEGLMAV